jgi:hypothetical protein
MTATYQPNRDAEMEMEMEMGGRRARPAVQRIDTMTRRQVSPCHPAAAWRRMTL